MGAGRRSGGEGAGGGGDVWDRGRGPGRPVGRGRARDRASAHLRARPAGGAEGVLSARERRISVEEGPVRCAVVAWVCNPCGWSRGKANARAARLGASTSNPQLVFRHPTHGLKTRATFG